MPFSVQHDATNCLVTIRMRGFWDDEAARRFALRLKDLAARSGERADCGARVILDLRGYDVQAAAMIAYLANLKAVFTERVGRFAVITSGSALQRLQLDRVFLSPKSRVVRNEDEAHAWVLDEELVL